MENQKNSKKLIAIIVAAVVIAAALAGVYFSTRPGSEPVEEITATPEVTEAPTEEPTEAPTEEPTEVPTEEPTEAPTEEPTEAPTEAPTEVPTEAPTEAPVAEEPEEEVKAEVGGADEPEAVAASAETSPDDVMVIVNGEAVNRAAFEGYRDSLVNYFQYDYDMTNADNMAFVGGMAMQILVEDTILFQKAADLGIEVTEEERAVAEVENAAQWADVVEYYMANYVGVTNESTEEEIADARTTVLALLEAMGYTENVMLERTLESMRYEKVYAYMVEGAEVTDADIQAAYEERVAEDKDIFENDVAFYEKAQQYYGYESFYTPEGYRGVTHILLEVDQELLNNWQALTAMLEEQQDEAEYAEETTSEEDADADAETASAPVTQEQVDAAYAAIIASVQETIDEIYAKLEAGTPFAELVEAYGIDQGMKEEPTKSEGYAVHMDSILWDPAFVAGAFSVDEVGAVSQPIVGSYGVYIIQYTRDVPAGPVELTEEMKTALREEVLPTKENELFEATLAAWKSEAEIIYSAEAQEMVNLYAGDAE